MIKFRKIVFWAAAAMYIIICPAVIMYVLGNFRAGIISLGISPKDAHIRVAGHEVKGPWPQVVTRVPAGEYGALIQATGYASQSRIVRVSRGETLKLESIILLPEPILPLSLNEGQFNRLNPVSGTTFILLESNGKLFVYDWKKGLLSSLKLPAAVQSGWVIQRVETVDGSKLVFIYGSRPNAPDCTGVFLDLNQPDNPVVVVFPKVKPVETTWDPLRPDVLFMVDDGIVTLRSLPGKPVNKDGSDIVHRGFGLGKNGSYWLDNDGRVAEVKFDAVSSLMTVPQRIPASPVEVKSYQEKKDAEKGRRIFGENTFFRIVPREGSTLFFLGSNGRLIQNELPHELVEQGVRDICFQDTPGKVLLWTDRSAGVIEEPREKENRKGNLESGRDVDWFYTQGDDIRQVQFIHNQSHALVLDRDEILLCELFPGATGVARPVMKINPGTFFRYAEETGTLYYLDAEQGRLHSLSLIPEARSVGIKEAPGE